MGRRALVRHACPLDGTHQLRPRPRRRPLRPPATDRSGYRRRAQRTYHRRILLALAAQPPPHPHAPPRYSRSTSLPPPARHASGKPRGTPAKPSPTPTATRSLRGANCGPPTAEATNKSAASTPPKASNTRTPASSSAPTSPGTTTAGKPTPTKATTKPSATCPTAVPALRPQHLPRPTHPRHPHHPDPRPRPHHPALPRPPHRPSPRSPSHITAGGSSRGPRTGAAAEQLVRVSDGDVVCERPRLVSLASAPHPQPDRRTVIPVAPIRPVGPGRRKRILQRPLDPLAQLQRDAGGQTSVARRVVNSRTEALTSSRS